MNFYSTSEPLHVIIAGIWVTFFQECQRQSCAQDELSEEETRRKLSRGFVAVMLLQCYSRGHVAITSSDPRSLPTVSHERLSMRSGLRLPIV